MSPARERPAGWPEGTPLAVSVNVMLEGWTDDSAPGIGPMDTAKDLDERGFSRAVRPHENGDRAGGQFQVDATQDGVSAEGLSDPIQADRPVRHEVCPSSVPAVPPKATVAVCHMSNTIDKSLRPRKPAFLTKI